MKKKRILSILMAGAMIMASPVAAFAEENYEWLIGDPESTDTSLSWVSVGGEEADVDGSDISVKWDRTDYPEESDIKIRVEDGDKTNDVLDRWIPLGSGAAVADSHTVHDYNYAKVEGLNTDDGGKTWTFTVRAADGETTQDYTIYIELVGEAFNCGHDSYEWVQYGQTGDEVPGYHAQRCTVCGKYKPGYSGSSAHVETEECEWELIDEGYHETMEKEGLADLYQCSVCGAYRVRDRWSNNDKVLENGEDVDEARRIESTNEWRESQGIDPRRDTPSMYEGRPDEEEFLDEWNAEIEANEQAREEAMSRPGNGTWLKDDTGWWFQRHEGTYPAGIWQECTTEAGSGWYHFDGAGYMQHGWFTDIDGNTYWLHDTEDGNYGAMLTGWQWIDGNGDGLKECYYFNQTSGANGLPLGAMLRNVTTPDGYTVNANGEWVVNGLVQKR